MPKISPLGQKLWPTGREQMYTQTQRHTEKVNTEDPFFRFLWYYIISKRSEHILKMSVFKSNATSYFSCRVTANRRTHRDTESQTDRESKHWGPLFSILIGWFSIFLKRSELILKMSVFKSNGREKTDTQTFDDFYDVCIAVSLFISAA